MLQHFYDHNCPKEPISLNNNEMIPDLDLNEILKSSELIPEFPN